MSMLKKNFKYSTLATAICLLYTPAIYAHVETSQADTLTVVGQQDNYMADFHSVVDTRSAQAQTAATTGQMLKDVPGITLSGTGITNGSNIMMRGYDQKGVKILIDGIHQPVDNTMNNLGGVFLESSLISRIKIKHGASSVMHGGGALGGVVSFYTLHPDELLGANKNLGAKLFSSFSSADKHFSYGGVIAGKYHLAEGLLAYSQRERGPIHLADNSTLNNQEQIKNYFTKVYAYPTETQTLILSARQYNNSGDQRQVLHRMGGYGKKANNRMYRATQQKDLSLTYHLDSETNDWLNLTTYLYYSQFKINQTFLTDTAFDGIKRTTAGKVGTLEKRTQSSYGIKIENALTFTAFENKLNQSVVVGIEADKQKMVSNDNAKNFPLTHANNASSWIHGSASTPLLPLTLSAGIRYNYYQNIPDNSEANDFFKRKDSSTKRVRAAKYKRTYQSFSENIGLNLALTRWLHLYSSYSTAFRAPTLSEMYNDSNHFSFLFFDSYWVPNSTLKPETNRTWEHGINFKRNALFASKDQLNIKASYYDTVSINHITYQTWASSRQDGKAGQVFATYCLQAFNLPKALINGFDVSLHYTHPYLSAGLNYNQTKTFELTSHETISMVRPETLTAFINIPITKTPFSVAWSGKFASPTAKKGTHSYFNSKEVTTRLKESLQQYPGYGVHSFAVNYQSNNKDIQASLLLANAFNKMYYSTMGVPQEARNIKMSVSYRW